MTFPNTNQYFTYPPESGNISHVDDSDLNEPGPSSMQPNHPSRTPVSTLYSSISPPTFHNPYQTYNQQHHSNSTRHYFEGADPSVPQQMVGYLPTPVSMTPSLNFPPHNNQQPSSAFYPHPYPGVYPLADPNHQVGQYSDRYQNPSSSNIQYDPRYPSNMTYYPYTPLPSTSMGYKPPIIPTHPASLTDMPSAADRGTPRPNSSVGHAAPQSSTQSRRDLTADMVPLREDRSLTFVHQEENLALRRPRSTPNVSNIRSSQLMTPSSPSISLTSPSTPDPTTSIVVAFAQDQSSSLPHTMMEDKSISQGELHSTFFPPLSRITVPSSSGSVQNSKWTCQWESCHELVRSQDRMAHALEHYGRKRFTCSCGHTFARSQDKKRHLREQAICDLCQLRPVGRNGRDGRCPSCRSLR